MTIATTTFTARRSLMRHIPELALALAGAAVVLLALAPIGWRAGLWHFRFSLLTLSRCHRLDTRACYRPREARLAWDHARARGAYRRRPSRVRALAL